MAKKKVLIISKSCYEYSTEKVIDWILYFGYDFHRLNGDIFESIDQNITIEFDKNFGISIDKKLLKQKYYSMWIRRWSDYLSVQNLTQYCNDLKVDPALTINLTNNISQDIFTTNGFILNLFSCEKYLSDFKQLNVNKINVLKIAVQCKLNVPKFILTTKKTELLKFYKKYQKIILKDLSVPFNYRKEKTIYTTFGQLITLKTIRALPDFFFLSFFQEYIEKEYEIRTFFLLNKIYSMAIFSQNNSQTNVDFRRYDNKRPNRTVPYQLPIIIENKIQQLMGALNLKTGSIDLIKCKNGKYYFLEVNPVGQFNMISQPCNYNLEFEIAKYLTNK